MCKVMQIDIDQKDLDGIEKIIRERDIIRTAYKKNEFDPYSLSDYFDQTDNHDTSFRAMFDRNIFSEIISVICNTSVKSLSDTQKTACALQAFFQISDTLIEPGMAIWELVDSGAHEQAKGELAIFRAADNLHPQYFIDAALGRNKSVEIAPEKIVTENLEKLTGEDLSTWKVHYGLILKLAMIEIKGGNRSNKLDTFLKWMYTDYIFSAPAIVFAIIYFSQNRFKSMLKNLASPNNDLLLRGIRNATWDMTIVHYWGQRVLSDRQKNIVWLFCTQDNALKEIAKFIVLSYNNSGELEVHFKKMLTDYLGSKCGQDVYNKYISYVENAEDDSRKINQCKSQEKIVSVIRELEEELLRNNIHNGRLGN